MDAIQRELVVEIRKRMEEDLTKSAAGYSHFAENTISRLQQAFLKKYHSRPYSHTTQDTPNNRSRGKQSSASRRQQGVIRETELITSEDGIAHIRLSNISASSIH